MTTRHVIVALIALWLPSSAAGQAVQPPPQGSPAKLPTELSNVRFNSGQGVVPYFEGWIRNPDGTFDMVFGYFNRNWQQELAIPVGPENNVEIGDGSQPTYFLPRRHRFVFRVRVPANFGKREVVWTITANGRTEKGYGSLIPEQEITERVIATNGGFDPGLSDPNKPPSIAVAPVQSAVAGRPVTLTALVVDDGLPKPRGAPAPAPRPANSTFGGQVNSSTSTERPRGLAVSWMQYGGPAKATFEAAGPILVTNGEAIATVRFERPGTYLLVASATDRAMTTRLPVTVTVAAEAK